MVNAAIPGRRDGRADSDPRPLQLTLDFVKYPEGSVLARAGDTMVVCNVTVEGRVPPFLRDTGEGWLTSEYAMLPRATEERSQRESSRGSISGRSCCGTTPSDGRSTTLSSASSSARRPRKRQTF